LFHRNKRAAFGLLLLSLLFFCFLGFFAFFAAFLFGLGGFVFLGLVGIGSREPTNFWVESSSRILANPLTFS
jgi:hypothetical protein